MKILLRNRKILLSVIFLISIGFIAGLGKLQINFSFESFYPRSDPEFKYYSQYQSMFSEEQNYVVYVALESPSEDIFNRTFLLKADSLFGILGQLEGVDSMICATRVDQLRRGGLSVRKTPYLDLRSEKTVEQSRSRIERDSSLIGNLITRDRQYVCGYIFIDPDLFDSALRDQLAAELDSILVGNPYEYIVSGIPYIRTGYIKKLTSELILFISLATFLILSVLFFTYRTMWGVLIPFLTVNAALIWILGLMAWTGQPINLITEMLVPIMFVVGMSDIIHLTTKYLQEIKAGNSPTEAIQITLKEIGFAILLTSITTAIGFGSLLISKVPPIRDFGLYAAIGVMFTWLISIIAIPNALLWLKPRTFLHASSIENSTRWNRYLLWIYRLTMRRPKEIIRVSGLIIIACLLLIFKIPLTTYLIEDIGEKDPIKVAMTFFEDQLYGLRPFEIGFHAKEGYTITDREILLEIEKIQDFLGEKGYFSPFFSPATIVQRGNYLYHNNREPYNRIPDTQEEVDELLAFSFLNGGGDLFDRVVNDDTTVARLSSRVPDLGSDVFGEVYADLDSFVVNHCNHEIFDYKLTGHAYLTEHNLKYLRRSLMGGLGIAFIVIGVIMGLLFRSWKMLIVSMIPNVIPLILTGGIMGLFGIHLTASTALVFVIAFGIAVDDTIHFLTRYRLEIAQGNFVDVAIRNTILGTGKAMVLTSLVLLGGFLILLVSDFGGTFNTGLFTGLTILFALLSDLILLPVMLRMVWANE